MDMIHAENDFALKSSMRQLSGELSEKIKKLRDKITFLIIKNERKKLLKCVFKSQI